MRIVLGIAAAGLLTLAAPASAQVLQLKLSGTLQGTQSTLKCVPGAPASCFDTYSGGNLVQSYQNDFSQFYFSTTGLVQGDNPFSFGDPYSIGRWEGVITNDNGVLTGKNLFYSYQSGGVRPLVGGSYFVTAKASSFAVAAVPEPGTWLLMLVGFGAIGTVLRSRPRRALQPA